MRDKSHDDAMVDVFKADPAYAAELLNSIMEDGDQAELLVALRQMTKAFGGMSKVAQSAELNSTQLYRALSANGNPQLRTLNSLLHSMGLRLAVQPIHNSGASA